MIRNVYSIFDVKAEIFSPPFFMRHNGEAMRAFTESANDEQSAIGKYPNDFKLMLIGNFDDETGVLMPHDKMTTLGFASDFRRLGNVTPIGKKEEQG